MNKGFIEEYPCTSCGHDTNMCYIVRHPKQSPSISYPTREEAEQALKELNE